MSRAGSLVAALALGAGAVFLALRGRAPDAATSPSAPPAAPAHVPLPEAASDTPPVAAARAGDAEPAVLRDTEVDGDLATDARGNLVVGPDVRRFFDYFLVAATDYPPESLRLRVAAEIDRRLHPPASTQALALFDRYLEYRQRAAELDADGGSDYETRLTALWALRREVIGPRDAAALFGEDEDSVRAALERQRIEDDPRLSPEEKDRALAAAEARLPDAERQARELAVSAVRLWNDEQALRARGGTAEEIRRLREERVGREAADRLEALDRQNAEFQSGLDALRAEQADLAANPSLTDDERTVILLRRIDERFAPEERTHARSLLGLL